MLSVIYSPSVWLLSMERSLSPLPHGTQVRGKCYTVFAGKEPLTPHRPPTVLPAMLDVEFFPPPYMFRVATPILVASGQRNAEVAIHAMTVPAEDRASCPMLVHNAKHDGRIPQGESGWVWLDLSKGCPFWNLTAALSQPEVNPPPTHL